MATLLLDHMANMIEKYRKPGETIIQAANRILYSSPENEIVKAIIEAERRERWKAGR